MNTVCYDPKLEVKAKYDVQSDGRWLAVVYQETVLGNKTVLTVGVEKTRSNIKRWIRNYMQHKCYLNNDEQTKAPDAYDRSKMN